MAHLVWLSSNFKGLDKIRDLEGAYGDQPESLVLTWPI